MLGDALGPRRDDIGFAQFIQQVGPHDTDLMRRSRQRQHTGGQRHMLRQIPRFRHAPRRLRVFRRKQAANAEAQITEAEIHQDQRQQEIRHREADEPHHRRHVIADGVLPHRRINPDRQRDQPGQEQGRERHHHGQPQPVADHLRHRAAPHHRDTEIALHDAGDPQGVLHVNRTVETVFVPHRLCLLGGDGAAGGGEVGDVRIDEITRRQTDDDESQNGDRHAGQQRQREAASNVHQHACRPANRVSSIGDGIR